MKKLISTVLCLMTAVSLCGCNSKVSDCNSVTDITNTETAPPEEMSSAAESQLLNIVDLTVVNHLSTDDALEEFYQNSDYTYYFPSIKSEYIECQFSNGDKMSITDALKADKVTVSDLDTYRIQYWMLDKNGEYINSLES